MKTAKNHILFDMSGTIFSSPVDWERENLAGAKLVVQWLKDQGFVVTKPDQLARQLVDTARNKRHNAKKERTEYLLEELLQETLLQAGIRLSRKQLAEAVKIYLGPELQIMVPHPGADRVLEQLQKDGYIMALLSNAPSRQLVELSLSKYGLNDFFSYILVSADIGYRKPHQYFLDRVRHDLSLNSQRALFVGDRLFDDIGSAHALGIPGILFSSREHPDNEIYRQSISPSAEVDNFGQLYTVLRDLL